MSGRSPIAVHARPGNKATDNEMEYLGRAAIVHQPNPALIVPLVPLGIHCTISVSERTGVSELIAKALSELVEKKPEDPLSYLAKQYPLYTSVCRCKFSLAEHVSAVY